MLLLPPVAGLQAALVVLGADAHRAAAVVIVVVVLHGGVGRGVEAVEEESPLAHCQHVLHLVELAHPEKMC